MKARHLHDWQMTPDQAKRKQLELALMVRTVTEVDEVRMVAGVDISGADSDGRARAAAVVLTFPELQVIETRVHEGKVSFPYVPGLLSFREAPLIAAVCEQLRIEPDLVLVDGQGIAHPRRFGLASHLGVMWDKPTIGCAKSKLCGDHGQVPPERGGYVDVCHNGEVIGAAVRTRQGVKPIYVSVGHRVNTETAVDWALRCCRGMRVPEPTRLAHLAASGARSGGNRGEVTSRRNR
jgi:deoxyribonuclease V